MPPRKCFITFLNLEENDLQNVFLAHPAGEKGELRPLYLPTTKNIEKIENFKCIFFYFHGYHGLLKNDASCITSQQ